MRIPFLDNRRGAVEERSPGAAAPLSAAYADESGAAELFAECALLRDQANGAGIVLDDTPESLDALDQLLPGWREDPEVTPWLGTDAGLYLGTVLVATLPGARWQRRDDGQPLVALAGGRELDVVAEGVAWAESGAPELSQLYAEAAAP